MCWRNTMNLYNDHGLPYMVMEYLKMMGVTNAGCFDTEIGSHGVSFYANEEDMRPTLESNNHETATHKLFFSKTQYNKKFYCNCIKKK